MSTGILINPVEDVDLDDAAPCSHCTDVACVIVLHPCCGHEGAMCTRHFGRLKRLLDLGIPLVCMRCEAVPAPHPIIIPVGS